MWECFTRSIWWGFIRACTSVFLYFSLFQWKKRFLERCLKVRWSENDSFGYNQIRSRYRIEYNLLQFVLHRISYQNLHSTPSLSDSNSSTHLYSLHCPLWCWWVVLHLQKYYIWWHHPPTTAMPRIADGHAMPSLVDYIHSLRYCILTLLRDTTTSTLQCTSSE